MTKLEVGKVYKRLVVRVDGRDVEIIGVRVLDKLSATPLDTEAVDEDRYVIGVGTTAVRASWIVDVEE